MLIAMLCGCGLLNGTNQTQKNCTMSGHVEKPNVTIGILKTPDDAPVELAGLDCAFAAAGLNPTIKFFAKGPDMYPDIDNGSVDIALTNYVNYFKAEVGEHGAAPTLHAQIIADAYAATDKSIVLLVPKHSPITKPADLVGKKVATQAAGNINELLLRSLLTDDGLNPDATQYLPIPFGSMPSALKTGQVDAVTELEPYVTEAKTLDGDRVPFPLINQSTTDMPLSGYVASTAFITAHPQTVAAFQRVIVQANKDITDPANQTRVLPSLTGVDPHLIGMLNLGSDEYPTSLDPDRIQRVIKLMNTYGQFNHALNAADLIHKLPAGLK